MRMTNSRISIISFVMVYLPALTTGADLHSEVQLLLQPPGSSVSGDYGLPGNACLDFSALY